MNNSIYGLTYIHAAGGLSGVGFHVVSQQAHSELALQTLTDSTTDNEDLTADNTDHTTDEG